jgi:hypothetical protein
MTRRSPARSTPRTSVGRRRSIRSHCSSLSKIGSCARSRSPKANQVPMESRLSCHSSKLMRFHPSHAADVTLAEASCADEATLRTGRPRERTYTVTRRTGSRCALLKLRNDRAAAIGVRKNRRRLSAGSACAEGPGNHPGPTLASLRRSVIHAPHAATRHGWCRRLLLWQLSNHRLGRDQQTGN